jgi:ATP-dependent protease ClpP protease subunit
MIKTNRVVQWFGPIDTEKFNRVTSDIVRLWKDEEADIFLFINSAGGEASIGFAFYDLMKALKIKLTTVAIGEVDSMAIIVFLTGEHRLVSPHTSMFFHQPSRSFAANRPMPSRSMRAGVQEMDRMELWYANIIERETGGKLSSQAAIDKQLTEESVDSETMIKLGLAHELFV